MKNGIKIVILIILINFPILSNANNDEIKLYVQDVLNSAFSVLNDVDLSTSQKLQQTQELLYNNLDLEWMAKFTLGRNRINLSKTQISSFTDLYKKYLITMYSQSIGKYDGQRVKVKNTILISDRTFLVKTQIIKNIGQGVPLNVDYMVKKISPKHFKIFDIITEGISMINTQQSEFNSVISNQGFDSLMNNFQRKLAEK